MQQKRRAFAYSRSHPIDGQNGSRLSSIFSKKSILLIMSHQHATNHLHHHDYCPMQSLSMSSGNGNGSGKVPSEGMMSMASESCMKGNYSESGAGLSEPASSTSGPVHPAAMALRLRVTQTVCGILTCVLGAVACIEEKGDFRVGTGVVAGLATVAASVASIHATFNDTFVDRARWIQYTTTANSNDCSGKSFLLSFLWGTAVVTNMVMLAFAFMAFPSSDRNLIIIGSLELVLGMTTLAILVGNLFLAVHYKDLLLKK